MGVTSLLFSFQGRINRGKHWLTLLIYPVLWPILIAVTYSAIGDAASDNFDITSKLAWSLALFPVVLFGAPIVVVTVWAGVATSIKRLHDRDKSGWWLVPLYLVPGPLGNASMWIGHPAIRMAVGLVATAVAIWAFVELFCLKGTSGPNRYGPDPLRGQALTWRVRV